MNTTESEWRKLLYGPANLIFNPPETQFVDLLEPPPPPEPPEPVPVPEVPGGENLGGEGGGNDGYYGRSDYDRQIAERGGQPLLTDPAYWGGWSPNISAKDVFKAYGKYMGNPMTKGFAMVKDLMNPTKDPLFQKAVSQYLKEFAPNMTLDQVLKDINQLYALDPNAKVNATDTARGYLMGLGPLAGQYNRAVLSGVMAPYEFAKQVQGMGYMGMDPFGSMASFATPTQFSTNPSTGVTTYGGWEKSPIANLTNAYLQNLVDGTGGRSVYNNYQGKYTSVDEMLTDSAREIQESQKARELSRGWMEDVLAGKTFKDFTEWKNEFTPGPGGGAFGDFGGSGGFGGGFGSGSTYSGGLGDRAWDGGYKGEYSGTGWSSKDMDNVYGEGNDTPSGGGGGFGGGGFGGGGYSGGFGGGGWGGGYQGEYGGGGWSSKDMDDRENNDDLS